MNTLDHIIRRNGIKHQTALRNQLIALLAEFNIRYIKATSKRNTRQINSGILNMI